MIYSFKATSELFNDNLTVNSEKELALVYQAAALCEKADVKVKNINSELLTEAYDDAGVQSNFYNDTLYISKKPLNSIGTLIKDFSEFAHLAIPFAIVCAAKGIQADLKGLQALTNGAGGEAVSMFQKEIYRFNINTDFCDQSKLKIYNNKAIQQKSKPVNVAADEDLCMSFIPLAVVFGNIEINLAADFFERYPRMNELLAALNFSFDKI
ncbi:MAG: hypothetical protein ABIT08_04655 [Bacteroidia bacterium]